MAICQQVTANLRSLGNSNPEPILPADTESAGAISREALRMTVAETGGCFNSRWGKPGFNTYLQPAA